MPSEKMRYWYGRHLHRITFQDSGLEEMARERLAESSPENLSQIIAALLAQNQSNVFTLISHCLELGTDHLHILLNAAIEHEKGENQIIYDDGENVIQQMIEPVLERSKALASKGSIMEAVEPILVVLVIIEHEMQFACDEGFTMQLIIDDCFKTLAEISRYNYGPSIITDLRTLLVRYNRQRSENNDNYDDEWNDVSDALTKS